MPRQPPSGFNRTHAQSRPKKESPHEKTSCSHPGRRGRGLRRRLPFGVARGPAHRPPDAPVTTDKTDYQPGETVVISGSGFAAGEAVNLTLREDPARHPDTQLSATADEYCNFVNKDFSPNEEHRGVASSFGSPIEVTTTGDTTLRYDPTGGQFIQNWQTPKTAGKCYQVRMTAKDGSKISVPHALLLIRAARPFGFRRSSS